MPYQTFIRKAGLIDLFQMAKLAADIVHAIYLNEYRMVCQGHISDAAMVDGPGKADKERALTQQWSAGLER